MPQFIKEKAKTGDGEEGVRKWTRQGDSGDDSAAGRREKGVEKLA